MSLKLGGSKSKTTSTSNSNSSTASNSATRATTTAIVPEWASSLTQGVAGRVGGLLNADPYQQVAPAHALQSQAAAGAAGLNATPWNYEGALDLMRGAGQHDAATYKPTFGAANTYGAVAGQATNAQSTSLLDNLDAYMSPYRREVLDAALDDFDVGAGQTRAQQDLDLAGSGAFGGSGSALTRSMTEDALVRGRATTSANLRDQMFQRGTALSADDANRRQQVALANAAAANQFGLANTDALNQAGQFNAAAQNQFGAQNANAANEAARFNAGAVEQTLQRQMAAARGLSDISSAYGDNQRQNFAAQAALGDDLRNIDQQQRQAPMANTQQIVAMLSGLPISLFTGQQQETTQSSSGSSTESSTGTSKTKGSSWDFGVGLDDLIKLQGMAKGGT
jgi:hypothetical protein